MSYGLSVKNDASYVQIDSDNPRLCALYSGTYAASGHYGVEVVFPAPIVTAEPPCIFIQNSRTQPEVLYGVMSVRGSAGAWTGFYLEAANVTWRPQGKWFAAVFASLSSADWGLRMWSADGSVIYDSGSTPVIVTKATNYMAFVAVVKITLGNAYYYTTGDLGALAPDEYFMINPFSRGIQAPDNSNWNPCAVQWDYSTNSLSMYSVGTTGWTDPGGPGSVFARLPGT